MRIRIQQMVMSLVHSTSNDSKMEWMAIWEWGNWCTNDWRQKWPLPSCCCCNQVISLVGGVNVARNFIGLLTGSVCVTMHKQRLSRWWVEQSKNKKKCTTRVQTFYCFLHITITVFFNKLIYHDQKIRQTLRATYLTTGPLFRPY